MNDIEELRYKLLGSFLDFTRFFFEVRTGRPFRLSQPVSRESHFITLAKALTKVANGEISRLVQTIPPRHGKTELVIHFIAWTMARYPDSNNIYVSFSKSLAAKQTSIIRDIIQHPTYQRLFDVKISPTSKAKDNFETLQGGSVYGVGSSGTITGRGAGILGVDRYGGAIIIDDIIKPIDAISDVVRTSTNDWYFSTLLNRRNNHDKTPIIAIGQRLHEDDLSQHLIDGKDGYNWDKVILPALDEYNNALYPEFQSTEDLLLLKKVTPYVFASQYQQNPQPPGGSVFKEKWFGYEDEIPNILTTFLTCDTAETDKSYNDATVFSLWGIYEIIEDGITTGILGLIWLECDEIWVEPKDLVASFNDFYMRCHRYDVKPTKVFIEKKSTGTTLYSVLKEKRGMHVLPIESHAGSGSKGARFLRCQEIIASRRISFLTGAKHATHCIEHMSKITLNDTHRYDDIADTCAYAIQLALIDKVIGFTNSDVTSGKSSMLSMLKNT